MPNRAMVRKGSLALVILGAILTFWAFPAFSVHAPIGALSRPVWEVRVPPGEAQGILSEEMMLAAAEVLNDTGFVVLRGSSIFSEEELVEAQLVAESELMRVKKAAQHLHLLDRAPWIKGSYRIEKLFEFQEALCYSEGRLDMPKLLQKPQLNASRWFGHQSLEGIAQRCFATKCTQTVLGALWNFPGSGPPVWHRDGDGRLLVAVTAAEEYPETVGFIHGQPGSHRSNSPAAAPPDSSLGEIDVPFPLRRGETLLFFYRTKHAATPNLSELDRCWIYSVHGPTGLEDQQNHKSFLPSIFDLSVEEAQRLDDFYQRQGYFSTPKAPQSLASLDPLLLIGPLAALAVCLMSLR